MEYALDLNRLYVQEYKELLKKQNLLPGRKILLQNIDKNFAEIESRGINTIAQLKKSLSTPAKMADIFTISGISKDYLVILKREIGSLVQKPVPLLDFPGIDSSLVSKLGAIGLTTSKEYWEMKQDSTDELFCLCDLVRINGVGPLAARMFYEAGFRTVFEVAKADASVMLNMVSAINERRNYYKGKLGQKDIQFCIDFAILLRNYTI